MLPKEYFLTSGIGESNITMLNAFDNALMKAGIAQCNLVPVSSIIPTDALEVDRRKIKAGTITFAVLAEGKGNKGETTSAGIGYIKPKFERHGIVVEQSGKVSKEKLCISISKALMDMRISRKLHSSKKHIVAREYKIKKKYGCVIAALVFVPL